MKIKICGLFRDCDIDFVNDAMPDYVGFVFAKSRRQISFDQAKLFKQRLHQNIMTVGVFVNESADVMEKAITENIVDMLQLHGQEPFTTLVECKKRMPHVKIIKALQVHDAIPPLADYALFDAPLAGSGQVFNWSTLPKIKKNFFLAGGINLQNIENAMNYKPYAIDISSGAEVDGFKNQQYIEQLVRKVRNARI